MCKNCEKGKYGLKVGSNSSSNCLKCAPGKHGMVFGSITINDCLKCMPGTYRNQNSDPGSGCKVCENGKYSNRGGGVNCLLCEKGKYSEGLLRTDHIECKNAQKGNTETYWEAHHCLIVFHVR